MFSFLKRYPSYREPQRALSATLDTDDFGEDIYLKNHIMEIALEVYKKLDEQNLIKAPIIK